MHPRVSQEAELELMDSELITTATDPEVDSQHHAELPTDGKVMDLVYWPDRRLIVPAERINDFDKEGLETLIYDMMTTMGHYGGVGLAAPQVGLRKRLFVWSMDGKHGYMINPIIMEHSGEVVIKEQCLSFPGVTVTTRRAEKVKMVWNTITGEQVSADYEGLPAICFQHETEHLEGMTMISTLSATKRDIVTRKMKKFLRTKKHVEKQQRRFI
jgi:peptide deformylase